MILKRFFAFIGFILFFSVQARALPDIQNQWGGHIKAQGSLLFYDDDSFWSLWDDDTGHDQSLNLRLKDTLRWGHISLEAHYDATWLGGDTYEKSRDLLALFPALPSGLIIADDNPDRRRLFDLSRTIHDDDNDALRHRLDRLFLSFSQPWGDCRIGRQAVTWGNGMIFNPMDVFNPFAPTDTQRDYKAGDDLVSVTVHTRHAGDLQFLFVPRRDPLTGDVEPDQASRAAKSHLFLGNMEMDVMGAVHYEEILAGLGLSGSIGGAAVRSDLTWSGLTNSSRDESGYVSFVINADYSWVWRDKNCYGLVEYHHTGLGHHHAGDALTDQDLLERISRNETYVMGRNYLGTRFQIELHPLVSAMLSTITNMDDASTILQPRLAWNATQNSTLEAGLTLYQGSDESEFGGLTIPFTTLTTTSPDTVYVIASWYF